MKADLVIKNGLVCTGEGMIRGGLAAKDGIIIAIGADETLPEAERVYDANGLLVLPGVVEPHCHLGIDQNPDGTDIGSERYYQDMGTESKAAVVGGVTTINTTIEGIGPGGKRFTGVRNKYENVKDAWENAYCDIKYYVGLADDEEVREFNELRKEGVFSCGKIFLGFRGPNAAQFGHPIEGYSNDFLVRANRALVAQEGPVKCMYHCEDAVVMDEWKGPIQQEEPICGNYAALWNKSLPGWLEAMDLCKTAYISKATGCPIYIVHMSAKETVEQLEYFKARHYDITGETCLHYLIFSCEDDICFDNPDWNCQCKVSPPIRGKADRDALWRGILNGTISCVGTDHTNYSAHCNKLGTGDFWHARPGCGDGMSLLMTGVFDEGVHKRAMSVPEFCKLMSENPARALGIFPQKGALKVGSDFDAVIFDPNRKWIFDSTKTYSTHVGSIYDGHEFTGKPVATFVRGTLVAENGEVVIDKPIAHYVKNSTTRL